MHSLCSMQTTANNLKGEENIGMAMTFTLVSHLREQLSILIRARSEKRRKEEMEKERLLLEVFNNQRSDLEYTTHDR